MIFSKISNSQISTIAVDTLFSGNIFNTALYNDVNLANLNSILNYTAYFKKYGVNVSNYYLSNVSKLGQNFYRDYNNFRMLLFYNIKENLDAGIGFQSRFFTDDQNVETNQNNSKYVFANADYSFDNSIFLNSKLGMKFVEQIGEFNSGFSGILTAQANNFMANDYQTNGQAVIFYENLIQKQNHNYGINGSIYKRFSVQADNTGFVKFFNLRNDFYFPATLSVIEQFLVKNNIESRRENYIELGDNLNYSLNENAMLSVGGFFVNRNITTEFKYRPVSNAILYENVYDSKILENTLQLSGGLNYRWSSVASMLSLIYNEKSVNNFLINTAGLTQSQIIELERAQKNKNSYSKRTSLVFQTDYLYSNTNTVGLIGSTSLLKYDTDFDQNFDDRDEQEFVLSAYHNYNNLQNFNVETRFDIILSKLSYIFSERSANNYKNRIYKLTSLSSFNPVPQFSTKNIFQVLANYTVYDYEDIVSQVQSFSYRQLFIVDSSSYYITRNISLEFLGNLKYYEQGQFNDDNFSVKPIAYFIDQFYSPSINYTIADYLKAGIGYNYFKQERFQYDNSIRRLVYTYHSTGPIGKISLYLYNNSIINFIGGLDFIRYDNPSQNNSALNLQLNIIWNM